MGRGDGHKWINEEMYIVCLVFMNTVEKYEAGNWLPVEKASLKKEHFNRNLKGLWVLVCCSRREEGSRRKDYGVKRD